MNAPPAPSSSPGEGHRLWPLAAALALLVATPVVLQIVGSFVDLAQLNDVTKGASADPWLVRYAGVIEGSQHTSLAVVAVLLLLYYRPLISVLWGLFRASLSGLLIAAEIGAVYGMVYGGLASIGMPGLFWHYDRWTEARAAFGVTLFLFWMLYLLFVRDFEAHRRHPARQVWADLCPVLKRSGLPALFGYDVEAVEGVGRLRWFLAYAGLPGLVALALPACLPSVRPGDFSEVVAWPWLAGMTLGAAAVAVLVWARAATRFHELWRQIVERRFDFRQIIGLDRERLDPYANLKNIVLIITAVFLVSYAQRDLMMRLFPPAFSICVVLGVVATVATWLDTRSWPTRLVIGTVVLGLLAVAGMIDYEVVLKDLERYYPTPTDQLWRKVVADDQKPYASGNVKDLESYQRHIEPDAAAQAHRERVAGLERWAQSFRDPTGPPGAAAKPPILVVVTTSGGALRAALWTESVLRHLGEKITGFPRHVRLITGASGGMLGAAQYVSVQARIQARVQGLGRIGRVGRIGSDYLTPIAWQIAFRDFVPNILFPVAVENRGDVLEEAWVKSTPGLGMRFRELKPLEDAGLIPSIVFSPMLVEDGRRLLISNLSLADLTDLPGRALIREDRKTLRDQFMEEQAPRTDEPDDYDLEYPDVASVSAVEFFRLFGEEGRSDLRLASAARMSATFPYVTSSVTLPTDPPRHVVDAGYYDNYGVNLAAAWIASHRDWISRRTSGVLVVQARAFRNEMRLKILRAEIRSTPTAPESPVGFQRWVDRSAAVVRFFPRLISHVAEGIQSLLIPVEGVAKARDSSMYFRNDEQLLGLQQDFESLTGDPEFFRTVVFTCDTIQQGQVAQNVETLNWYIDPREHEQIAKNMGKYDPESQTGRARNQLRVLSLLDWWRAHGGAVAPAAATAAAR